MSGRLTTEREPRVRGCSGSWMGAMRSVRAQSILLAFDTVWDNESMQKCCTWSISEIGVYARTEAAELGDPFPWTDLEGSEHEPGSQNRGVHFPACFMPVPAKASMPCVDFYVPYISCSSIGSTSSSLSEISLSEADDGLKGSGV